MSHDVMVHNQHFEFYNRDKHYCLRKRSRSNDGFDKGTWTD